MLLVSLALCCELGPSWRRNLGSLRSDQSRGPASRRGDPKAAAGRGGHGSICYQGDKEMALSGALPLPHLHTSHHPAWPRRMAG